MYFALTKSSIWLCFTLLFSVGVSVHLCFGYMCMVPDVSMGIAVNRQLRLLYTLIEEANVQHLYATACPAP
jgi:hypothetical protein